MKNVKKVLAATALSGAVLVGAGFGTYSWFTSSSNASGTIENGTLELNENANVEGDFFDRQLFAPSNNEVSEPVTFENTGSLLMVVDLNYVDSVTAGGIGNYYGWIYYGVTTPTTGFAASQTEESKVAIGNDSGSADAAFSAASAGRTTHLPEITLQPGQSLVVRADITLHSLAGNEYQGATYTANFEGKAKQTDAGAQY
jgi:spore coat-associated protein N